MHIRRIAAAIAALAAISCLGCSKSTPPFPNAKIEKITRFSLGSAKMPKLPPSPSAEQVLGAVKKPYGSFETVAASYQCISKGNNSLVPRYTTGTSGELRIKQPNEALHLAVSSHGRKDVYIVNQGVSYVYDAADRTFSGSRSPAPAIREDWTVLLAMPSSDKSDTVARLNDAVVGSASCYVVEILQKLGREGSRVTHLYLGRSDLLVRRVYVQESGSDQLVRSTYTYSGFVVNAPLSDDLFPKEPPKGAKGKWTAL